jgi:glycosyltransferase involved in cell wall biosynthesis
MHPFASIVHAPAVPERIRLLYVGQLIERKGLKLLFKILSIWAQRHRASQLSLVLVGDGNLRNCLAEEPLPQNLKVEKVGSVPHAELPRFYERADILVFPTLADEWGLVVNEALASAVPVLGSLYSQAVEELVLDGVNGWTFRPDHPEELYAALDRALSAPTGKLQEMRVAARKSVEHLTSEFVAGRILDAIRFVWSS